MIEVDGSHGEGGGAVLRTALALSAALGEPVAVENIRAGRPKPGLKAQHLAGARALAEICGARTEGLALGSTRVAFTPGPLEAGEYSFDVGTAGAVTLVLQALLPALAFAPGETLLRLTGGTDVAWSPPLDYTRSVFLPLLKRMGYSVGVKALKRGFYPRGGGIAEVRCTPAVGGKLKPFALAGRGELFEVRGSSVCGSLPAHVCERQAAAAEKTLLELGVPVSISREDGESASPGTSLVLGANFSNGGLIGASALGARNKTAEAVGEEAARELLGGIASGASVDVHACDQLLVYCALAHGESFFTSPCMSSHAETNAWVARQFINREVKVERQGAAVGVRVPGIGFAGR